MAQPTRLGTSSPAGGLSRTLPLWSIVGIEVVAIAVFVVLRAVGQPFTISASIAAAVGVVGALLAIRAPSRISVYGRVARRINYFRRYGSTPNDPPIPFDLPQSDGTTIGARWADDRLITVVRIARPVSPTVLKPSNSIVSTSQLSLGVIAKALSQFDIELESIDVVAHGWRSRGAAHLTGPYVRLTSNLPTLPQQDVWVVLRLNPLLCPDAIASRGGGSAGVLKTAMAATRRVANHLAHEGYRPSILTAHGISAMSAGLIDNANVDDAAEDWSSITYGSYSTTAYTLDTPVDAALSNAIWTVPSASTTCAIRLTRDGRKYALSTVIRYATIGDLTLNPPEALRRLDGRQRPALNRTLPVGSDDVASLPVISLDLDELDAIRVVDGGHGQLFGADVRGEAIAVPLFGSDVRRVDVYGSAFLTQQIVVRAIAVGAKVIIKTDRPDSWRPLVSNVNDARTVFMTSPIEQSNTAAMFTLCILDAREATEDPTVGTQLRVHRTAGLPERLDETSDVAIYQQRDDQNRVYVVTRTDSLAVSLVSLPAESALIEGARQARTPEPVAAGDRPARGRVAPPAADPRGPGGPPQQNFQRPDRRPGQGPGPGGQGPGAGGPGPGGPGPGPGGPGPGGLGPGGPPQPQRPRTAPRGYTPTGPRDRPAGPPPGATPSQPDSGPASGRHNRHSQSDE
ncbi:type VII secretion protein EccE [Williamsia phyllosphaerae]|uniref:Type VII secretion system protein EccE domain-containing protein n=1 Tax=Williamsia phyllosphaerae TaxID=885042 RepID=A0ABQ1U2Q2_9NOCA|nr:type VII secretion protein EccE [Williamsia phyllosphaerae]GGF08119.1 hypothetical protein GCM10007298_00030 [Williamsia phyllosphaerae]